MATPPVLSCLSPSPYPAPILSRHWFHRHNLRDPDYRYHRPAWLIPVAVFFAVVAVLLLDRLARSLLKSLRSTSPPPPVTPRRSPDERTHSDPPHSSSDEEELAAMVDEVSAIESST